MGFRCFLLAYRETGQGAVVMTNGENGNWVVQRAFARIASAYGWPDYPQERAERDVPDDAALAAFAGTYDLRGAPITVSRDGGNLLIAFPGQRPIEFVPHSADGFAGWIDATIRFDLASGEPVLVVLQNGEEIACARILRNPISAGVTRPPPMP